MISKFVTRFEVIRSQLYNHFLYNHPEDYEDIFNILVSFLRDPENEYDFPDPKRITVINDGGYQGTIIFVVGAGGYQPATYWATTVDYGSCSGCDALAMIRSYNDEPPTKKQAEQYLTLALHMLQEFKQISGDE